MKILLFFVLINLKLVVNTLKIYPLNEVGEKHELKSDLNETYYFFTPINNLRVNDVISYYITSNIPRFNISYAFLETDKYELMTEEDINKYTFNYTLNSMDYNMIFKTIIKANETQKGLLLKMKLVKINSDSFAISRINMTLSERKDQTFVINKNENKYFYFDLDQDFLELYDVFIFPSNLGTITYYKANFVLSAEISLYFEDTTFIYINSKFEPRLRYIHIRANDTNSVILNVKILKKNKFLVQKEFNIVNNIELCNMYPNQNEKYFLYDLKNSMDQNVFYNKLYGDVESYYIFLNEVNNLDDYLNNKKQNMKKFETQILIRQNSNMKLLTYFKCINDSPAILDLYNLDQHSVIYDERDNYFILQSNETRDIGFYKNYNNSNISFGYMGCELDESELITIKYNEYEIILDKNNKKKILNNINVGNMKFNVNFNSNLQKSCVIKIELGQNDNYTIYPLKEYNYTNTSTGQILFVSPKEEENYHYIIETSITHYKYYEEDDINSFHIYLNPLYEANLHYIDVENSVKFLKSNLTHITYFNYVKSNSTFKIKKMKELNLEINKFFYHGRLY